MHFMTWAGSTWLTANGALWTDKPSSDAPTSPRTPNRLSDPQSVEPHFPAHLQHRSRAKYGGSMAVGQILLNIDPEGTPSTKLGPKMGMESRSLVRTLQTMELGGRPHQTHRPCKEDKRVVRIHLTAKGKQMRDVSRNTVIQFNEAVQSRFTLRN
jgi:DNA-binding MarR family transcriptional regulator